MFTSIDQYRDKETFELLLKRLRCRKCVCSIPNDDVVNNNPDNTTTSCSCCCCCSNDGTKTNGDSSCTSRNEDIEPWNKHDNVQEISEITFLTDPSSADNDAAAGELGDALQVQLHNVINVQHNNTTVMNRHHHSDDTSRKSSCNTNVDLVDVDVPVVNHLEIVTQHLSATHCEKYQSLLDYIANQSHHRDQNHNHDKNKSYNNNLYLESITINAHGDYSSTADNDDHIQQQQRVVSKFLEAIRQNTTLQQLTIVGCYKRMMNIESFVTFLNETSIQIFEMDCLSFALPSMSTPTTQSMMNRHSIRDDEEKKSDRYTLGAVPAAFCANRTIQELYLEIDRHTLPFVTLILWQLQYNTTIRHLRLEWSIFDFMVDDDETGCLRVKTRVMDVIHAVVRYLSNTTTLRHIEFIHFQFVGEDILQMLLMAMSSNKSIQILTFQQCTFDHWNWVDIFFDCISQFIYLRRLEMELSAEDKKNRARINYFMDRLLPCNLFLKEVCLLPMVRCDSRFIQRYLCRNRGVQQFIQQYAPHVGKTTTTCTNESVVEPAQDTVTDVGDDVDENDCHRNYGMYETVHTSAVRRRRDNHQYHAIRQNASTAIITKSKPKNTDNQIRNDLPEKKSQGKTTRIPLQLVPTILSNHFKETIDSSLSSSLYTPTIIYQMISSNVRNHCIIEK